MKLTRRKIRRLIRESIIRLNESVQTDVVEEIKMMLQNKLRAAGSNRKPLNREVAAEILNKIKNTQQSDLMYIDPENIQKMIAVLQREISSLKNQKIDLQNQYYEAQSTERGRFEYPPSWYDGNVVPVETEISTYEQVIQKLRTGRSDQSTIMGVPITPLTEDEEYTFDVLITDTLQPYIAWSPDSFGFDTWDGHEKEFREALLEEIKEQAENPDAWPPIPEDRWEAIAQYVMDDFYNSSIKTDPL